MTTVDSYSESNQDDLNGLSTGTTQRFGQVFSCSQDLTLVNCKFYLKKSLTPTGNATAKLYAITGTYGTDAMPTGSALATSDTFDVSTLTTSFALVTFDFSGVNQYNLTSGTKYAIELNYSGDGNSNHLVIIGFDSSSPSHSGNFFQYVDHYIAASNIDVCFYVNGVINYLLTSSQSSLSLTGETAMLTSARVMALSQVAFALSLQDSLFATGKGILATFQPFALSGLNTTITSTRTLTATMLSLSLSGQSMLFSYPRLLSVSSSSFLLTCPEGTIFHLHQFTFINLRPRGRFHL